MLEDKEVIEENEVSPKHNTCIINVEHAVAGNIIMISVHE